MSQVSQEKVGSATLLKRYSNTGVFVWNLRNFEGHLFYRISVAASGAKTGSKIFINYQKIKVT